MTIFQLAALRALSAYKKWISPMMPAGCRYVPTCSEYAQQAIATHGILRGSFLAFARLIRCHPFVSGGFDPVPCKNHSSHIPIHSQNEQTL